MRYSESHFDQRLRAHRRLQRKMAIEIAVRRAEKSEEPRHLSFGQFEVERRSRNMTGQEVNDWLKLNGIPGGDRRKA
jgi:hypothetical protein